LLLSIVFQDYDRKFQNLYEQKFGEYLVKIPSRFGRGYISGINFPNGVGLF